VHSTHKNRQTANPNISTLSKSEICEVRESSIRLTRDSPRLQAGEDVKIAQYQHSHIRRIHSITQAKMNKLSQKAGPEGKDAGEPEGACECKIYRNASKYGFEDIYRRLPDLWLGKDGKEHSLRELQRKLNVEVLRSSLEDEGEDIVVGETEAKYDVLTGDDYTAGQKTEVENYLRSTGIDVEELKEDFVSHQSVANHFYDCLGKKKGKNDANEANDVRNMRSLEKMAQNRLEQMVEKYRKGGRVNLSEEYRIETEFYVVDEDGDKTRLADLFSKTN